MVGYLLPLEVPNRGVDKFNCLGRGDPPSFPPSDPVGRILAKNRNPREVATTFPLLKVWRASFSASFSTKSERQASYGQRDKKRPPAKERGVFFVLLPSPLLLEVIQGESGGNCNALKNNTFRRIVWRRDLSLWRRDLSLWRRDLAQDRPNVAT